MAKTLCDWKKKDLLKKPEKLFSMVSPPRFYCKKCARVANDAKRVCSPKAFAPDLIKAGA